MARSFTERLTTAQQRADLTISDLAVWFSRPRSTVNTWVAGRTPSGPSGRLAHLALECLEWGLAQRILTFKRRDWVLPIPVELNSVDRPGYVEGTRDAIAAICRIPALRSAR